MSFVVRRGPGGAASDATPARRTCRALNRPRGLDLAFPEGEKGVVNTANKGSFRASTKWTLAPHGERSPIDKISDDGPSQIAAPSPVGASHLPKGLGGTFAFEPQHCAITLSFRLCISQVLSCVDAGKEHPSTEYDT
jgi:hypothetical protein